MIGRKQFSKVDEIFDAALDRPPEERLEFVERACAGDRELAADVARLLELSSDEESVFPSGALAGPLWDEVARELQGSDDSELAPGTQMGAYEIVELLGRGGMGSVYRAKDTGLGRDVAVKVLSGALAEDEPTLKRFEREAKLLASLNHPNIAAIYDVIHVGDKRYLILELVEGETLAERLARGPLELRELLVVSEQIAEAVAEAHRKGVVHRDLKPANIKLTGEGRVKVLDFGLAKTHEARGERMAVTGAGGSLPTTEVGIVLGTPGYMSPEQARGTSVDKRTDVWAFGCLLYEMATGRRAFTGTTASDAIAAVLRDHVHWEHLPSSTPDDLRRLIARCLEQDPRDRLQDIGDARIEISELRRQESRGLLPEPGGTATGRWVVLAAVAAFFAGMAFYRAVGPRDPYQEDRAPTRTMIALGPEERLWVGASSSLALSPDGSQLAFVGDEGGRIRLYLRALDEYASTSVRGSDDARDPFFSPDGKWIGFFAEGEMKKVGIERGIVESITEAGLQSRGASWGATGEIVFAQDGAPGLFVVSENGGEASALSTPDAAQESVSHLWPQWLPGEESVLFTVRTSSASGVSDRLAVLERTTGDVTLLREGSQGRYLPTGHVVYLRGDALEAAAFDPSEPSLGPGIPMVEGVHAYPAGATTFALSDAGALVYLGRADTAVIAMQDRRGDTTTLDLPAGNPGWPRIARDGRRAAVHIGAGDTREVWVVDLARPGSVRQLTFQGGGFPTWSPDGSHIAFMSRRGGSGDIYVVPSDGSGPPRRLLHGSRTQIPVSWSPQGILAYYEIGDVTQRDIWVVDVAGDEEAALFVATPANELSPVFSPDGRHVAYVSNETGQNEVYVRPYPPPGPVIAVSIDGGSGPVWSADGRELYYRHGDTIVSVPVEPGPELRFKTPEVVLEVPAVPGAAGNAAYDVFPDGNRFLVQRAAAGSSIDLLRLVLSWHRELEELVPTID